jgi:hypothetical protein
VALRACAGALALESGDLLGALVCLALGSRQLVLRIGSALVPVPLLAQAGIVDQIACGLLDSACDPVNES